MDKELEGLLPFYALGALSEDERARVERYLQADPEAMARVREYQATAQALSYVAQPVAPSLESRQALMQRVRARGIQASAKAQASRWRSGALSGGLLGRGVAATSLVVAMVSLGAVVVTRYELGEFRAQNIELLRQLQDQQQVLRIISESDLISVEVQGTEEEPQAHGRLFVELDGNSGVLLVAGLPPLEPGMTYQAWLIRDGTPFPAGLFQATAEGLGTLSVEAVDILGRYNSVAVSVEPILGSLLPSGSIVLLGDLSD